MTDDEPLFTESNVPKRGDERTCPVCASDNLRFDEDGKYCADCGASVPTGEGA